MALASPVDPRGLIESYEALREASRSWLEDPRPLAEGDAGFAELALVTSDRAFWEPYACALGFSSERGPDPVAVLSNIPFDALFAGEIQPAEIEFFAYSAQFATIEPPLFAGGAYALERHYRGSSFANSTEKAHCVRICVQEGGTPSDIKRCIQNRCLNLA